MKRNRDINQDDGGGGEKTMPNWRDNIKGRARNFTDAMDRRDYSRVMELLEQGVDEATLNRAGGFWEVTPLEWACKRGLVEIASLMIDKGARLETGYLYEAYSGGSFPMMKALIDRGVNIKESSVLHCACDDDRPDVIKFLLENGFDIKAQDHHGRTPLQCAWWKGNVDTIKFIIENGVDDPNTTNDYGGTAPIHEACEHGILEMVKFLIQEGADVNLRSRRGDMPLNFACGKGHVEVAKFLIAHGANAHAKGRLDHTPLHSACVPWTSRFEVVKFLLIENGSNVNAKSKNGFTPLHYACKGRKNLVTIELLIKFGADIIATDEDGKTPLHTACGVGDVPLEIIESLIEHGSDVNAKDTAGMSPFHWACTKENWLVAKLLLQNGSDICFKCNKTVLSPLHWGSLKLLQFLFENGADLDTRDQWGRTCLHTACSSNRNPKVARFLIDIGADLNARDNKGDTPLHTACETDNEHFDKREPIKWLIENGANLHAKNDEGNTPLVCLFYKCWFKMETAEFLLENGAQADARTLILAIRGDDFYLLQLFIENGADPNQKDAHGVTPFQTACQRGDTLKIVEYLLEKNVVLNIKDNNGTTPLHAACDSFEGRLDLANLHLVKLLVLEHGANLDASDRDGTTPLYLACKRGHLKVVEFLLSGGANVNMKTTQGSTPLHAACDSSELTLDLVKLLVVVHGANLDASDRDGMTPLHLACKRGHLEVVEFLLAQGANENVRTTEGSTLIHAASEQQRSLEVVWYLVRKYPWLLL